VWWIYILAQLTAAILACSVFAFVSGLGPLNPYTAVRATGVSWPEAIMMWITGSPPRRLSENGRGNIMDLMRYTKVETEKKRLSAAQAHAENANRAET
jgi:hypothetical protein